MAFRYKVPRKVQMDRGRVLPQISKPQEVLSGVVQGKAVPEDEERAYRAALKTGRVEGIWVQFDIGPKGLPGHRQLDQLINTDTEWRAIEIDGVGFVHKGASARAKDRLADMQRVDGLRNMGIFLRRGVEHVPDTKLQNQDDADRTYERLL